jgi:hypothetical protein
MPRKSLVDFRLQRIWAVAHHWPLPWWASFVLLFAGYSVLVLVLHGSALNNGWSYDDTQILKHALIYSPWQYFTDAAAWRALVPFNLTPWLSLQFDADAYIFGLQPLGFYVHALVMLAGLAVLMHTLVRAWTSHLGGLVAAVLMLLGATTAISAQQLMVRHYTEGLFYVLLGIWLFLRALKSAHVAAWLSGLSALCFLIAVSAKELYVPLAVLPLLVPVATWRLRLQYGWPWLLVLALYVPWRLYMLGSLSGGYTPPAALLAQGIDRALSAFAGVPGLMLPWWAWASALVLMAVGLAAWGARERRAASGLWLTVPGLLLVPLVPLALGGTLGEERFLVAVWATLCVTLGGCAGMLARHGKPGALVACMLAAVVGFGSWTYSQAALARMAPLQAQYFALADALLKNSTEPAAVWVAPDLLPHFALGLVDLRRMQHESAADVQLISDEVELASVGGQVPVLRFDATAGRWEDVQSGVADELRRWRSRLRDERLDVSLTYDLADRTLAVKLHSGSGGKFFHVGSGARTEVPSELVIRAESMSARCFLIRHDRADGGVVYSPWLYLKAQGDGRFFKAAWSGAGLLDPGTQLDCERSR